MLYPSGNAGYASVRLGNLLAWRSLLLCLYAACLGCRFVLEQPNGTALNVHPAFEALCNHIEARELIELEPLSLFFGQVWSTGLWHGLYHFFKFSPKRQRLFSNDHTFLRQIWACAGHLQPGDKDCFQGEPTTKRRRQSDGKVSWSGAGATLKSSQLLDIIFLGWKAFTEFRAFLVRVPRECAQCFGVHIALILKRAWESPTWPA